MKWGKTTKYDMTKVTNVKRMEGINGMQDDGGL